MGGSSLVGNAGTAGGLGRNRPERPAPPSQFSAGERFPRKFRASRSIFSGWIINSSHVRPLLSRAGQSPARRQTVRHYFRHAPGLQPCRAHTVSCRDRVAERRRGSLLPLQPHLGEAGKPRLDSHRRHAAAVPVEPACPAVSAADSPLPCRKRRCARGHLTPDSRKTRGLLFYRLMEQAVITTPTRPSSAGGGDNGRSPSRSTPWRDVRGFVSKHAFVKVAFLSVRSDTQLF